MHLPTGTCFNRHGELLTIGEEFTTALVQLQGTLGRMCEWVDCEGLERRHTVARGVLIALDIPAGTMNYLQRRRELVERLPIFPIEAERLGGSKAFILHSFGSNRADAAWSLLQQVNDQLSEVYGQGKRVDFWEGLVAKRMDSLYPIQLRNPSEEFPFWSKHRFIN